MTVRQVVCTNVDERQRQRERGRTCTEQREASRHTQTDAGVTQAHFRILDRAPLLPSLSSLFFLLCLLIPCACLRILCVHLPLLSESCTLLYVFLSLLFSLPSLQCIGVLLLYIFAARLRHEDVWRCKHGTGHSSFRTVFNGSRHLCPHRETIERVKVVSQVPRLR